MCLFFSTSSGYSFERGYKTFFLNFLPSMTTSCYVGSEVSSGSGGTWCLLTTACSLRKTSPMIPLSVAVNLWSFAYNHLYSQGKSDGAVSLVQQAEANKQKLQWFITWKDVVQHMLAAPICRGWERDSHGFHAWTQSSNPNHSWKSRPSVQQWLNQTRKASGLFYF